MSNKPVIILFNGFGGSKFHWEYYVTENLTVKKLTFLDDLKKIGDVYTFTSTFFNFDYYTKSSDENKEKKWRKIFKKYKPYSSDIDFTLEDLDYKNICEQTYNNVIEKYGTNRKFIVIGHSYGGQLAILFSKLYKNKCMFCVCIDNTPYDLDWYKDKKYTMKKKDIDNVKNNFDTNIKLKASIDLIKNADNQEIRNKELPKIYNLISYKSVQDRIKYYDKKLYIPTLFFRKFYSKPPTKFFKEMIRLIK